MKDIAQEDSKINPKHLREGNWLRRHYRNEKQEYVNEFFQYHPSMHEEIIFTPWEYKPIIITGSVQHRCDLKSICNYYINGELSWHDRYYEIEFQWVSREDGTIERIKVYYHKIYLTSCRYLHELQNLYLDLSGKEMLISKDLPEWMNKYKQFETDINFN